MKKEDKPSVQTQIAKPFNRKGPMTTHAALKERKQSVPKKQTAGDSAPTTIVIKRKKESLLQPAEQAEHNEGAKSALKEPHEASAAAPAVAKSEKKQEQTDKADYFSFPEQGKRKKKSRISKMFTRLRHAVKKCFSPLSSFLNGIDTDFSDRSPTRKVFIALFKLKVPLCILLAVIIALSGCYFMIESNDTATTEMSLNYEESAYGLNPNSTRFNVYNIAGKEVVSQMLTYCGIDPGEVDLNRVSECISVNPTNKKAFDEKNLFITTTYRITLTKPPEIKGVNSQQMLNFLCKAYKDYLYSNYTENRSILSFDIDRFNDEEFLEIADLLDLKAQQIAKYLNTRVKQSKTFTEKDSDETFKSLSQKVEDLRTYDIAKYRAFVIEAGCSHEKASFLRSLSYINRMKQIDYDKDISAYNVHNNGIKMYDEAMISVVMIPSIDESKNTYYMSKTKTGMDYMAQKADEFLATAQETAKEIKVNREIMGKMKAGANEPDDILKANKMIENIRTKFTELSGQIETVDKAYIKYKTKDYLTFKTYNPSLLQKLQLTSLAVIAVVFVAVVYAALWLRFRYFSGGKQK